MIIEPGLQYTCSLVAHLGLLGKRDVEAIIDVDTPTHFSGFAHLVSKPIKVLGMKVDDTMRLYFDNGVIAGNNVSFSVTKADITATLKAEVANSGAITGSVNAGGVLSVRLTGSITDVQPLL